ncbi:hypothetical protein C8Q69DRAFT_253219 [Paecilomyces variotii]|uniref:Uncharacterized protein n=1 Tax=Byssochlamys spectabilis TaxID=264951 RepID=A0A443HUH7_BYSSP|nr:hypothetical protein C8Q69DRAFT_253219 [Paecilomyces variotii]KAH1837536.1 hypothetical protein KXX54_004314 [Aspergillus fumigatus]RWQ95420.1 hypothetical protein C8Q69DRAFT_253219 [Paecilomyces variotii]
MDTMAKRTIKAQLVPAADCQAHWIITFSELSECINANLTGNTLHYTRHHVSGVLDTIEFHIRYGCPPIDQLKGDMWLPGRIMQRQEFCRCTEWVWGVIWRYTELGCIEKLSTDGVPLDELWDKLLQRQTDALTTSGCLEVEADTAQEGSRNEEDNGQEVRSVKVMHRQHQEAEE